MNHTVIRGGWESLVWGPREKAVWTTEKVHQDGDSKHI